jgi:hypothetical protein
MSNVLIVHNEEKKVHCRKLFLLGFSRLHLQEEEKKKKCFLLIFRLNKCIGFLRKILVKIEDSLCCLIIYLFRQIIP